MPPQPEPARSTAVNVSDWFAAEVQPHEQDLRSWLRRQFPRNPDVDDVVQESYLRLLRVREAGKVNCARAYLFATARNVVLGIFRRARFISPTPVTEAAVLRIVQDGPDVAELVSTQQDVALLLDAIDALPGRCREIFILRKLKGVSHREIAERLGISEETVQVQIGRGAKRCFEYLHSCGARR